MNSKLILLIFIIITVTTVNTHSRELGKNALGAIPDYGYNWLTDSNSVRRNFWARKSQDNKAGIFDKYISNNTIYVDGISHYKIEENNPQFEKIKKIEDDFNNLISMKGVKYIYKRDGHWRTWREVDDDGGNKTVVCYRCENLVNASCTDCHSSGYWVLEEGPPPCPYELFSVINNYQLCAAYYNQLFQDYDSCPSVITFSDLSGTCENPIITRWRFTKVYTVSERKSHVTNLICSGREICEILTLYEINSKQTVFRIINSNYDIIYSRVMEDERKNYACTADCGRIDSNTMKFAKNDKPFELNLLTPTNKKKRENSIKQTHMSEIYSNMAPNKKKTKLYLPWLKQKMAKYISRQTESKKKSHCKELLGDISDDEENESCGD